jgi:hypothetical protein
MLNPMGPLLDKYPAQKSEHSKPPQNLCVIDFSCSTDLHHAEEQPNQPVSNTAKQAQIPTITVFINRELKHEALGSLFATWSFCSPWPIVRCIMELAAFEDSKTLESQYHMGAPGVAQAGFAVQYSPSKNSPA